MSYQLRNDTDALTLAMCKVFERIIAREKLNKKKYIMGSKQAIRISTRSKHNGSLVQVIED
jgi:hypothetical protein